VSGGRGEVRMASDARAVVFGRIRAGIGGDVADAAQVRAEWDGIERDYVRQAGLGREEIVERLVDRLHDYDAQVLRVSRNGVREGAAQMLAARGVRRMVIPAGLPAEWLPDGVEFLVDEGMSAAELDAVDGVMTASTLAIAETGTIVLQGVSGQGRRAVSLVPDYHLCVVDVVNVVETVPEAMAWLQETAGLATTFISGPSATADIEMTRIKGVHGPRFLDVLLVGA
jgi:L-lactate dehydrogenase complex protein LldG